MHMEYHKWFSPVLGHVMELKVYGYYGKPVLVFLRLLTPPSSASITK